MKSISKLKDEARRYEQKEEWEKAINAYLQVLRIEDEGEGEVELPLYNRIGDLCVRLGRAADAVRYYEQAADRYAEVGLYNNAIALCNKVLRHRPDHLELIRKLGQFSALQGFLTEARRYFLQYADYQLRHGQADAALAALTDFAGIVDDGDARELLGRRLHDQGRHDDAMTELRRAYALYVQSGDTARAEAVRSVIRDIDPQASVSEDAVAPSAGSGGSPAADLPRLDDIAVHEDAVAGGTSPADAVAGGTSPADADPGFVVDRVDDVEGEQFGGFSLDPDGDLEVFGAGQDVPEEADSADEVPDLVDGLESTTLDFRAATAGMTDFSPDLGIETDESSFDLATAQDADGPGSPGSETAGAQDEDTSFDLPLLDDDDATAAESLPLLDDDRPEWEDWEATPAGDDAPHASAAESIPLLSGGPANDVGDDIADDIGDDIGDDTGDDTGDDIGRDAGVVDFAYLPTFESDPVPLESFTTDDASAQPWGADEPLQDPEAAGGDASSADPEPHDAEPPWIDAGADSLGLDQLGLAVPPDGEDALWQQDSAGDDWHDDWRSQVAEAPEDPMADEPPLDAITFDGLSFIDSGGAGLTPAEAADEQDGSDEPVAEPPIPDGPAADEPSPWDGISGEPDWSDPASAAGTPPSSGAQEPVPGGDAAVESVDDDAPMDKGGEVGEPWAEPTAAGDGVEAGEAADDEWAGPEPAGQGDEADTPAAEEWTPPWGLTASEKEPETEAGPEPVSDPGEWEPWSAPSEAVSGAEDVREPHPPDPAAADPPRPDGPDTAAVRSGAEGGDRARDFVDLRDLVREDKEQTTRFRVSEAEPSGDEDRDFAALLGRFRAKVSEHLPVEEAAAHYDLALAFKEMGLLDEAIAEFQIALRGGQSKLKIYEELGYCFLQKEEHAIAAKVLSYAIGLKGDDELNLLGVYYHMGRAYEALGQADQARDAYQHVLAIDFTFQDAAERLTRL